jgi:hypothetical protein
MKRKIIKTFREDKKAVTQKETSNTFLSMTEDTKKL